MQNTQKLSKVIENCQKFSKKFNNLKTKSKLSKQNQNCHNVGQVMFPHHSDKVSQSSQVFRVALCMSKVQYMQNM